MVLFIIHGQEKKLSRKIRGVFIYQTISESFLLEVPRQIKVCTKCNSIKPITEFNKNSRRKDGLNGICKECINNQKVAWIKEWKEKRENNEIEPIDSIKCVKCGTIKKLECFDHDSRQRNGYMNICKDCRKTNYNLHSDEYRQRTNQWRKNNPEKAMQYMEEYLFKNKKRLSEQRIKWRKNNLVKDQDGARRRYLENKELYNKISSDWFKSNPLKVREYNQKRKIEFGYMPINTPNIDLVLHHLHLENNHDFVISIPEWLHRLYYHNSRTWENMDTINAIALDYWINEDIYNFLNLDVCRKALRKEWNERNSVVCRN